MRIAEFQATNEIISGTGRHTGMPSTSGLPKADPAAFGSMGRALAQLGRVVTEIGHKQQELEAKRQAAKEDTEALSLYTSFVKDADQALSNTKATVSPEQFGQFLPAYSRQLDTLMATYGSKASNDRVRDLFMKKAASFYLERHIEARRHQDKLEVDYHTGALTEYLAEQRRQIAKAQDEASARLMIGQTLGELRAKTALIGADKAAKLAEEFKASEGLYLAQTAISRNPFEFLPAEEGGGDGFKRYLDLVDGTRMDDLLKTARSEADRVRRARIDAAERHERLTKEAVKAQVTRQVTEWLARLDAGESPDVIQRELDARGPLGLGTIVGEDYEKVRTALKQLRTDGDKEELDKVALQIEADHTQVSMGKILANPRLSTGQKRQLIEMHDKKRQGLDLSDNPVYKHGLQFVERSLGGAPSNLITQALRMQGTYNVEQDRLREKAVLDYRFAIRRRYKDERALLDDPEALKRVTDIAQDIVDRYIRTYPNIFSTGLSNTPGSNAQAPGAETVQNAPLPARGSKEKSPGFMEALRGLFNPFTPPQE